MKAREFLTAYHPFFGQVNDATAVSIMSNVKAIIHACSTTAGSRVVQLRPNADLQAFAEKRFDMYKPFDHANSAAFCDKCNILWVMLDAEKIDGSPIKR